VALLVLVLEGALQQRHVLRARPPVSLTRSCSGIALISVRPARPRQMELGGLESGDPAMAQPPARTGRRIYGPANRVHDAAAFTGKE